MPDQSLDQSFDPRMFCIGSADEVEHVLLHFGGAVNYI